MIASVGELIAQGRRALRSGDAAGARDAFTRARAESPGGDVLEGLARAAYLDLDHAEAIELWEQAYAAHREAGDRIGAVRVARMLAYMHGTVVGDRAVMSGWMARARTLLGDAVDSLEGGWIALDTARFEPDPVAQEQRFRATLAIARRFADTDLECVTMAYLGAALVRADRTAEGMALLDEALAGVAGGEVDDFISAQEVFCQLFGACEHARDVARAGEWIRIGEAIAARRRLPAVAAFCRTHYGAILTAAGRWPEADTALTDAVRLWGLGHRSLRGGALVRLADLRVRQGRLEEAEQLLVGCEGQVAAARPVAAIHLARGQPALARETLERALEQLDPLNTASAPLLALLVEAHVAAGLVGDADAAARRLEACAAEHPSPYLTAAAALARGMVCVASAAGDPCACLREAVAGFDQAQMPMELAQTRLELAAALAGEQPRERDRRGARRARGVRGAAGGAPRGCRRRRCCARSGCGRDRPPARATASSRSARPRCSTCSVSGSRTPRSPSGSTSAARPPSTTSATSSPSSACAAARRPPPSRCARSAGSLRRPAARWGTSPMPRERPLAVWSVTPNSERNPGWPSPTTRSSSALAAPDHRPRCCSPAWATACCCSTARRSRATRSRRT